MKRALLIVVCSGCVDSLDEQISRIDHPRVLAVIAEPAEAAPRDLVTYAAVVAAPDGPVAAPAIAWAYCTAPKPPTEDDVVSPPCIVDLDWTAPLGTADTVAAAMPAGACATYGPDTPPGGFRPRDPDASGGYYQPVRAAFADAPIAIGLHRIACNLADAPPAIAAEFRDRYPRNHNPTLSALAIADGGIVIAPDSIVATATYTVVAGWPPDTAEPYPVYDRATIALVDRRESLRVGWFATAGRFASDATGVAADDVTPGSSVAWTAPTAAGPVHLWAVLHDDRGGVAVRSLTVTVR